MDAAAVDLLVCPICAEALRAAGATLRCDAGHSFDVARQGYVNLADQHAATGDDGAMVGAREEFLGGGWFAPIAAALAEAAGSVKATGAIVDSGAGTGWYLAAALEAATGRVGLALDASRYAAQRAARAHPRATAIVCDVWRALPVRDGAAAVVLDVFAPRHGHELARVLAPGGALLVITPTDKHLAELAEPLGLLGVDARKHERLQAELGPHLDEAGAEAIEFGMRLDRAAVRALAAMGPAARHLSASELDARVDALPDSTAVTASVTLRRFLAAP